MQDKRSITNIVTLADVLLIVRVVLPLIALSGTILGLWHLTGQAAGQVDTLRTWALLATLAVPAAAAAGYGLGRIEARGWLSGADQILDRMTGLVRDVSTIRDTSRITVHQATRAPGPTPAAVAPYLWGVATPQLPTLAIRAATPDEVDSL